MKHRLKQRIKNKAKNQSLVLAADDWFPCIDENKVRMTFDPVLKYIGIWGDDDFGMEKFNATEEEYLRLKSCVVSKKMLKSIGFVQA